MGDGDAFSSPHTRRGAFLPDASGRGARLPPRPRRPRRRGARRGWRGVPGPRASLADATAAPALLAKQGRATGADCSRPLAGSLRPHCRVRAAVVARPVGRGSGRLPDGAHRRHRPARKGALKLSRAKFVQALRPMPLGLSALPALLLLLAAGPGGDEVYTWM